MLSKVWIVTGESESGDKYGPYVFAKKPTQKQLKQFCEADNADGEWTGPGNFGSYIYLSVKEHKVR